MKRNKYLDDLGISRKEYGTNNFKAGSFRRWNKWRKQRKNYGFDDRETWYLGHTYIEWLYSHLRMYRQRSNVDMDASLLTNVVVSKDKVIEEISMSDAYIFMTEVLGNYLKAEAEEGSMPFPSDEVYEALHMFASTFMAWWW